MVRDVEHFRVYLLGRDFLLRTDHAALMNLLMLDLPPTILVQKWILRLLEYTFRIEYQKGSTNIIADVISKMLFATEVQKKEESEIDDLPEKSRDPGTIQMFLDGFREGTESSSAAIPKQSEGCFFFSNDPEDPAVEDEEQKSWKLQKKRSTEF